MKLAECFHLYHWHDSHVHTIEYHAATNQLIFQIDLCEWIEPTPFSGKSGWFIFSGVRLIDLERPIDYFDTRKNPGWGSVIEAKRALERDQENLEGAIIWMDWLDNENDFQVLSLTFLAGDVEWKDA